MDWDIVNTCHHEWSNYYDSGNCATEYCSWTERRCRKCGVYETICGCGFENGMSGNPRKWGRFKRLKKRLHYKRRIFNA